ncbi:MAG: S9 family peptidase, partial [Rikenellaceae bacterium]|nr:S9 family peptidase [Rikenellaceae bacterium]
LNGYFKKPADFDPNKKYPVLMTQYSGPGSQQVTNSWGIGWEDVLVQNGYVVACVDGRGTGYRGEEFKKCTYRNLGKLEVEDQISAARYLGTLPWVDASRIGIYGWSFGGFMALNCILKGADVFKMAIAVAPVTSWRYYDTIYTEVYNGLPQDNAEGYDDPSPINHADKLKGKLLICHGSADDNVHPQNAIEMVRALGKAGKLFDMMYYPDANHSMVPGFGNAVRQKMVDYTLTNL